ncbi:superoxide dismutase [Cu-Zn] SodC [Neisseriaceae bacterium JH1-16]|nr:superoxide dismutase [Cu-Zn] SodC [Neisseriaceae bacterium JH1-16]
MIRLALALGLASGVTLAQTVDLSFVDAYGSAGRAGTVTIEDTPYGALLTPRLTGLAPGLHGFHLHEHPSCASGLTDGKPVAALAAGGHWDPDKTGRHEGPYGNGHKGDLPALYVAADGRADYPVLAPRLKAADFAGHALMVHVGGDNHSDHPAKLGGGGARLACGVVGAG